MKGSSNRFYRGNCRGFNGDKIILSQDEIQTDLKLNSNRTETEDRGTSIMEIWASQIIIIIIFCVCVCVIIWRRVGVGVYFFPPWMIISISYFNFCKFMLIRLNSNGAAIEFRKPRRESIDNSLNKMIIISRGGGGRFKFNISDMQIDANDGKMDSISIILWSEQWKWMKFNWNMTVKGQPSSFQFRFPIWWKWKFIYVNLC